MAARRKILLQIFSKTVIGPIFFEFIQRKGDDGFGEGNFRRCSNRSRPGQVGVLAMTASLRTIRTPDAPGPPGNLCGDRTTASFSSPAAEAMSTGR
jgi:hypothetical protein